MRGWGRDWPDSFPVDGAGAVYGRRAGRDGGIGRSQRTLTDWAGASLRGRLGWPAGSVPEGCRQTGCGIACSRARAQLNFSAQGQRSGRCRVRRRADRVRHPAREKTRRRRVLVVTIRSPRPRRAVQWARLCAITWTASLAALAAKRQGCGICVPWAS